MDYNDDDDNNELIPTPTPIKVDINSINISSISNDDNEKNDNNTNNNNDDIELSKLQIYAKAIIIKAWKRYLDRKTFRILKNSLNELKKLCTNDILRKLNPRESVLFNDPLSQGKIRFSNGQNIHYFSGYRIMNCFSDAYHDAYKLMGNRNFEKVINKDNVWNNTCDIANASDVTNKKEYIQYMNSLDKKPIYLGGRNNGWRELSTLSISIPLYEKEICNIYERNKTIYSSNCRNNKIANKKVTKSLTKKNDSNTIKFNNNNKKERKIVKLMSKKKSNLRKQKERIKKMQRMYQLGMNNNQEESTKIGKESYEDKEKPEVKNEEENEIEEDSYSSYDSSDYSTDENDNDDGDDENFNNEEDNNIEDIENDDFQYIYEWANELSFENTFHESLAEMKI
ncbi:hypothetical protein BCR32DRAFT_290637 [Anaeromyces robustus]|uniref:Uncharacterized protein n=1 Tax=Anaeromyces robustus TaxID=1754192 RepID=A0A1Y1XIM6_9FUNG|nr:hypothetical protein BCR32DRAFT_290637 [Anaeromyces robustus]|eukprot:ORX85552.1 hypothetical protein BCR32DRAFT_290637 [Anaeromyces robustus]